MDLDSLENPTSMAGIETHERVSELVQKYCLNPSKFLDLGAGQGAFSKHLSELGHQVLAIDGDATNWKVSGIDLVEANLDSEFAYTIQQNTEFDAIVAIEIIEHIENPFSFARESSKLLKKGGLLFLTTPNVEAVSSRLIFLYTGRLKAFGEYETVRPAHITPIFRWKLEMLLDEAGFEIIDESFNRMTYETGSNFKSKIASLIGKTIAPFLKGSKGGEGHIIVARLK